jgi:tellurite resistance-related uncharacterized protein
VTASDTPEGASLPVDAFAYRRTDLFNENTVPPGLLKAHSTKAGVWGLIHVIDGDLVYRIEDPRRPASTSVLTPAGPPGVVEPTILHSVKPQQRVRFYVEFHRRETGAAREGSS